MLSHAAPALAALALAVIAFGSAARADDPSWLASPVVLEATRRAVLHAALDDAPLRSLARRVRAAGWMPELSADVTRGLNANTVVVTSAADRAALTESMAFSVHLRFHLDRVVFDPHETGLARASAARAEQRIAVERMVIDLLAQLERLRVRAAAPTASRDRAADADATVEAARLEVTLEVLTGGPARALLALAPSPRPP